MEHEPADTKWTSRCIQMCAKVCISKWWILFSGVLMVMVGFSIAIVMFEELTVATKIISLFTGVIGASFVVYALTLFRESENPQETIIELRGGQFYINGREAGTSELNQATRRDPRKLPQFWERRARDDYSRSSPTNSESSDCIFTNIFLKTSKRAKRREVEEDAKSVSSNTSQITMLVHEVET